MKKHNEGYTLPLVMVVLLVLAIVAVTIMTTSMNNMLRQQGFIETMKNQYAAQGEIEKIVAQLENIGIGTSAQIPFSILTFTKGQGDAKDELSGTMRSKCGEGEAAVIVECSYTISASGIQSDDNGNYTIPEESTISMESTCGEVTIHCDMKLSLNSNGNEITYTSYEIVKGGAAE